MVLYNGRSLKYVEASKVSYKIVYSNEMLMVSL